MQVNEQDSRFELEIDGHVAYADYRMNGDELVIDFVYAPPELRGTGAAGKLMRKIKTMADAKGWSIDPICGYAAAWLRKNG